MTLLRHLDAAVGHECTLQGLVGLQADDLLKLFQALVVQFRCQYIGKFPSFPPRHFVDGLEIIIQVKAYEPYHKVR